MSDAVNYLINSIKDIDLSNLVFNYYMKKFEPDWTMGKQHLHNAVEIIYCLEGTGNLVFDNDVLRIKKREAVIIAQGVSHLLQMDNKGGKFVNIQLDTKELDKNWSIFPKDAFNSEGYIRFFDNALIGDQMKNIAIELAGKEKYSDILVKVEIICLIIRLNRIIDSTPEAPAYNKLVQKAMRFIENTTENVTPKIVADEVHVSSGYLMHLFKEQTGKTVKQYAGEVRMERGKKMLIETNLRITDIAYELGYESLQHYSMDFKKYTGMSPRKFRSLNQTIYKLKKGK